MKRVGLGGILACLALLGTACPKQTPAAVSRSGGWHLVETPRVLLQTDLPVDDAKDRAVQLEQEIAGLLYVYQLLSPRPTPALRPTRVILFSDCASYKTVAFGEAFAAAGYARPSHDHPLVLEVVSCDRDGGDYQRSVLFRIQHFRHELSHVLNNYYFGGLPPWLNEGLAEYFGGLRVYRDKVQLGHPRLYREGWRRESPISFDALRVATWEGPDRPYHAAWKATYAMLNASTRTRDQAVRFLAELAAGTPEVAAWNKTMRPVEAEVKQAYADWKPLRDHNLVEVPFPTPPKVTTKVREMSKVDVAALMVEVSIHPKGAEGPWVKQLTDALANLDQLDAAGDRALFWRAVAAYYTERKDIGDPKTLFDQYRVKRPDDPRGQLGWFLVSLGEIRTAPDRDAQLASLSDTVAKLVPVATSTLALDTVARYWLMRGKPQAAYPFVVRALGKNPGCPSCYATLAAVRFLEGKYAEAVQAQERAVATLNDESPSKAMLAALAKYKAAATSKATPPP